MIHRYFRHIALFFTLSFFLCAYAKAQELFRHKAMINEIEVDSIGNIYFQDSEGGIYRFGTKGAEADNDYNFNTLSVSDKPEQLDSFEHEVSDFLVYDDGLLIATPDKGIWVYKDGSFRKLFYPGLRFPIDIKRIELKEDILWIQRINGTILAFDNRKQLLHSIAEDVAYFDIDNWNVIYFSSSNKLYKNDQLANDRSPVLHLSSLLINGTAVEYRNALELSQADQLQFNFFSHYPVNRKKSSYQYKLNDDPWTDFQDSFSLQFNKPETYNISVRSLIDAQDHLIHESYQFVVKQKLLLTLWPYLFAGVGLLFLIAFFALLRSRANNKSLKKEREKIKLQIDLLKTQQRLKQAQMNPHFLYNALNALKGLIVLGETRKAADGIGQFAMLMRSLLEKMDAESISIEEELEFLHAYLKLEQSIRAFEFDYKIETDLSDIEIPSLMIQPFVENAIIHGLSRYVADRSVSISLERESYYLKVRIIDKGRGAKEEEARIKTHESKAVKIFVERCEKLDRFSREDYLLYEKESNPDGSSQTSCILYIPINRI